MSGISHSAAKAVIDRIHPEEKISAMKTSYRNPRSILYCGIVASNQVMDRNQSCYAAQIDFPPNRFLLCIYFSAIISLNYGSHLHILEHDILSYHDIKCDASRLEFERILTGP